VTVANALTALDPPFHLIKTVTGGPSSLSGTFIFNIDCGAVGTFTQSITLSNATSGSVAINNLPYGTACTFSEASSLPTAPTGFTWGTLPARQSKTIDGSDVTFVNTLSDPAPPEPVPALRIEMLAALIALLLGGGVYRAAMRDRRGRRRAGS
jgi:hypothetical protein